MIAMSAPQNAANRAAPAMSVGSPQKQPIARAPLPTASTASTTTAPTPAPASPASRSTPFTTTPTTKPSVPQSSAVLKADIKDALPASRISAEVNNTASAIVPSAGKAINGTSNATPATTNVAPTTANGKSTSLALSSKTLLPKSDVSTAAVKVEPSSSAVQRSSTASSSTSNAAASTSGSQSIGSLLGIHDLEAVAQAAMGLDANGNPLPGNEESHRSLAEAVKRLSAMQNSGYARATGNYVQPSPQQPSYSQQPDSQQYAYAQQMEYNSDGSPMKRFQCHLCDRAFARAYNLNTHLATHDPDPNRSKPFPCPYASCKADGGRSFSRKHDLQRHVASTHENEPPPEDEEIDENGERISTLVKLGLGTPGRKFRCDDCGRAFVRRDALKRHQCMPAMNSTSPPPPQQQQQQQSRPSANGSGPSSAATASAAPRTMKGADAATSGPVTPNYSTSIPAGLSLYTSTAPTHTKATSSSATTKSSQTSSSSSSTNTPAEAAAPPPFYPAGLGLSYESLTREVQDMAMQLVAQASTYNQAHTSQSDGVGQGAGGPKAASKAHMPGPSSSSSATPSAPHPPA